MIEERMFPENCQFINCFYTFENKYEKIPDSIIVVYKDENGEKHYKYIENPEYQFYITKDYEKQKSLAPNKEGGFEYRYISLDEVNPINVKYKDRYRAMAKYTPSDTTKKYYQSVMKNSESGEKYKLLEQMHLFPEFHASDVNIVDYYICKFCEENDQQKVVLPIDIAAFDIEVAGAEYDGFPNEDDAPCEVNMVTYYNFKTNTLNVFALKYDTDTFKEGISRINRIVKRLRKKYKKYFGDFDIKMNIYNNELSLIASFFDKVNTDKPDYCLAWNARFDIFTLYNRLVKLLVGTGYNPEDIMCPEDFPIKKVTLRKDTSKNASKDFTARTDTFNIYGWTVWVDALPLYGNITRPKGKKDSYTLNSIGLEETGMAKEDLSEEDTTIKTAYLDSYPKFLEYSCVDTLLLALILKNTGHVDLLHTIVTITRTRSSKALTKTVCLRNFIDVFYHSMGYTISNNRTKLHDDGRTGIRGAFVAPPENIDLVGNINGIPSNKCFDLVIDEDLSSMYPNIIITFNISSSTADMKIKVNFNTGNKIQTFDVNGKLLTVDEVIDVTKEFMEKYLSEDVVSFCHEYYNLPDYDEMYKLFA